MKIKGIGKKGFSADPVYSLEELKAYYSPDPEAIEDIRFTFKGYDASIGSNIYLVEALYKNDDGYWTVGYSDSDSL